VLSDGSGDNLGNVRDAEIEEMKKAKVAEAEEI